VSSAITYKRLFANFQTAVWKRACQFIFGLPSAEKHGMGEKYVVR
jgi:hypothetical protein